jgi:hypothetical protein
LFSFEDSTMNYARTLPLSATLLAVLGLGSSTLAVAGTPSCLTRGSGPTEHFLSIEGISDINQWISQGALLVHRAKNEPMCSANNNSCNVAVGDVVTVSASDDGHLVLHRTRQDGRPLLRDVANLLPSADGRYLTGFSPGTNGPGQQVFLYYTGTGHCTDTGLDYPADSQCRFFEFEVFPVNVMQGDRPDALAAKWSEQGCPNAAQQPGSGGTGEPPKP